MVKPDNHIGSGITSGSDFEQPDQLALSLPISAAHGREDLIVSPANELAVEVLDHWPDWPGRITILAGPIGSGKSHLANIWAERSHALVIDGARLGCLRGEDLPTRHVLLENVGNNDLFADPLDEAALFHLINHQRQSGNDLLITSRTWPQAWGVNLPDLMSRLRSAQMVELSEPDDVLLRQVMVKLFADRQLLVAPSVIDYLIVRMERSLGVAGQIVEWMDQKALARSTKITRNLAGEALKAHGMV